MRNQVLLDEIRLLREAAVKNKASIWYRVAELLERPKSRRVEVNLSKIRRYVIDSSMIVVPGKVLGVGNLPVNANITIGAHAFSESALSKINATNNKAVSISELVRINPRGNGVRIIV